MTEKYTESYAGESVNPKKKEEFDAEINEDMQCEEKTVLEWLVKKLK